MDKDLEKRIVDFGRRFGLNYKIPNKRNISKELYLLYVSYPSKIKAHKDCNEYGNIDCYSDEEKLLDAKKKYDTLGFHTFSIKISALSAGKMQNSTIENPVDFADAIFHEGFHTSISAANPIFEENAASFVGMQTAYEFFKEFGNKKYFKKICERKKKYYTYSTRFLDCAITI
jgi:hypothetical protein